MSQPINQKYVQYRPALLRLGIISALVAITGCATTPEPHPRLTALQNRHSMIVGQEYASQEAASELEEAQEAIDMGRTAYREDDEDALAHYIFMADKTLDVAATRIDLHEANVAIDNASERKQELQISARERALQQAENRARNAEAGAAIAADAVEQRERQLIAQSRVLEAQEQALQQRDRELDATEQALNRTARELDLTRAELAARERQARMLSTELEEVTTKVNDRGTVLVLSDIVFDTDSAELNRGSERVINAIAAFLDEVEPESITIEGHTDSTGAERYNDRLSENRAASVQSALESAGIEAQDMQIKGYGESYPVATNDTSEGRQLNRRVEIIIDDQVGRPMARR